MIYFHYAEYGWRSAGFYLYSVQSVLALWVWFSLPSIDNLSQVDRPCFSGEIRGVFSAMPKDIDSFFLIIVQLILMYASATVYGRSDGRQILFFGLSMVMIGIILQVRRIKISLRKKEKDKGKNPEHP